MNEKTDLTLVYTLRKELWHWGDLFLEKKTKRDKALGQLLYSIAQGIALIQHEELSSINSVERYVAQIITRHIEERK